MLTCDLPQVTDMSPPAAPENNPALTSEFDPFAHVQDGKPVLTGLRRFSHDNSSS